MVVSIRAERARVHDAASNDVGTMPGCVKAKLLQPRSLSTVLNQVALGLPGF